MVSSLEDLLGKPLFTLEVDGRLVTVCFTRPEGDTPLPTLSELRTTTNEELAACLKKGEGPIAFLQELSKALDALASSIDS
jgi:hypothetical protein